MSILFRNLSRDASPPRRRVRCNPYWSCRSFVWCRILWGFTTCVSQPTKRRTWWSHSDAAHWQKWRPHCESNAVWPGRSTTLRCTQMKQVTPKRWGSYQRTEGCNVRLTKPHWLSCLTSWSTVVIMHLYHMHCHVVIHSSHATNGY